MSDDSVVVSNTMPTQSVKKNKNKIHPMVLDDSVNNGDVADVEQQPSQQDAKAKWTGKLDFFLSALSYSVGLGAVWRFPYLCYRNGGGAFLIPFSIFLVLIGMPLMYLELSVGQFTSLGPMKAWCMVPLFKGVGLSMNILNSNSNTYYVMVIAYSLYYLAISFNWKLPWEKCDPSWASPNCVDNFDSSVFKFNSCEDTTKLLQCPNGKCYLNPTSRQSYNQSCDKNDTNLNFVGYWNPIFPAEDFWNKQVLDKSTGIDDLGSLKWGLILASLISWILVFMSLFNSVKIYGKISYFTALFPYLIFFALGIRGYLLDGSEIGIEYYLKPDLSKLARIDPWRDAAVQVFYTLSLSYGGLIALSSYNNFHQNILRYSIESDSITQAQFKLGIDLSDTIWLAIMNFLTCLLAGFVVFTYIGSLSKTTGLSIDNVVQSGQGLIYVVYPFAVTTIKGSAVWSVLFFLMVITLGMGSMMAGIETLVVSLEDVFPYLKKTTFIKRTTLGVICFISFLASFLLCTQSGTYWVEFFDTYCSNWSIFVIALVECISISWFYGVTRFKGDLLTMIPSTNRFYLTLSHYSFYWLRASWTVVTPLILALLTIFSFLESGQIQSGSYLYPKWSVVLGYLVSSSTLIGIAWYILVGLYQVVVQKKYSFRFLIKPDEKNWRPQLDEHHRLFLDQTRDI